MAASNTPAVSNFNGPIVIDPLTRIEGHLRIEVEVTGGKVSNAFSSSTLFRGLETILIGRDPQDAQHITQRACGVCTFTHALASTRAVDNAVKVQLPPLAVQLRNLVLGAHYLHDHMVHFYHLHALDFVNVANCAKADVNKAAAVLAARPGNKEKTADIAKKLGEVQARVLGLVKSGQLGHFTNAYFLGEPHPAYRLSPELDLIATAHYLDALKMQVKAARACAVFGGKHPHPQFTIVGGVTNYDALRPERIKQFTDLVNESVNFVNTVYIPDLLAIAAEYKDVATYGGTTNFMGYGEFSADPNDMSKGFFKPGILLNRGAGGLATLDNGKIKEHVRHSWYKGAEARAPHEGLTEPVFTDLHGDERYSWSKAPRYDDLSMEVGPLAQMLVAYTQGHPKVKPLVDMVLGNLNVGPEALFSTLGRTAARGIETAVIAGEIGNWIEQYKDQIAKEKNPAIAAKWEMPNEAEGVGFVNAPRGGLSHWIRIENKKIANFQLVVPTTWNIGPRCANGKLGPVEEALIGTPIADPKRPVEILRTVHSFDPCIACAVHVIDPESNERRVFNIL